MKLISKIVLILSCILAHGYAVEGSIMTESGDGCCGEKCNFGPEISPALDGPKGAIGPKIYSVQDGPKGPIGPQISPVRDGPKGPIGPQITPVQDGPKGPVGPQISPVRDGPKGAIGVPCPLGMYRQKGDMGTSLPRIGPQSTIEMARPVNVNAKRMDGGFPVGPYVGIKGAIGVPCPLGLKGLKGDVGVIDGNGTHGVWSM